MNKTKFHILLFNDIKKQFAHFIVEKKIKKRFILFVHKKPKKLFSQLLVFYIDFKT